LLDRVKTIAKQKGKTVSAILNELLRDFADGESEIESIKKRLGVLENEVAELKMEKKPH